jgi:hypothetical protein
MAFGNIRIQFLLGGEYQLLLVQVSPCSLYNCQILPESKECACQGQTNLQTSFSLPLVAASYKAVAKASFSCWLPAALLFIWKVLSRVMASKDIINVFFILLFFLLNGSRVKLLATHYSCM